MTLLRRYWRIWLRTASMAMQAQLTYRLGSFGFLLGKMIRLLFFFAFMALISRDQDSIITGFATTTENGLTKQAAMSITVHPDNPNEIAVNGPGLPGTMTR